MLNLDLDSLFDTHNVSEVGRANMADIREACADTAYKIKRLAPEGAEKTLALTKLQEVMFWANAGIARSGVR